MTGFHFVDHNGTDWMILAGLPADFPNAGEEDGPPAGLTFRAGTGEIRVLLLGATPRRASAEISVPPLGTGSRVRDLEHADWEHLLQHAEVWPPA